MTTKATSRGVRRTLVSSRRSRRLATLPTPSGPGRLSLYRSATRSRRYITKLVADAPLLPAEARAHLAALLADTTNEA